jgi:hypothetical protein
VASFEIEHEFQWGRAHRSAETEVFARGLYPDITASMGPRSQKRGNSGIRLGLVIGFGIRFNGAALTEARKLLDLSP